MCDIKAKAGIYQLNCGDMAEDQISRSISAFCSYSSSYDAGSIDNIITEGSCHG